MTDQTRQRAALAARIAVTVGAAAVIVRRVDLSEAAVHLAQAPGWVFVVPGALALLGVLIQAIRLRLLLDAAGCRVPLSAVLGALLRAGFVAVLLPSGGSEVARLVYLSRVTRAREVALAAVVAHRLSEIPILIVLLLSGLALGLLQTDPVLGGAAAVIALLGVGTLTLAGLGAARGDALIQRFPRAVQGFMRRTRVAFLAVWQRPDRLAAVLLLSVPVALLNSATVWAALWGYGHPVPFGAVLTTFPAADTLISLPISIGGVGVREGVFVHMLAIWGVAESAALAVGLTQWIGELFRSAAGGVLFLLRPFRSASAERLDAGDQQAVLVGGLPGRVGEGA